MTEAELTAEVEKLCGELGLLFHHCPDGRGCHGQRGFPDLIVVGVGGLALLELKSADGETSADQDRWLYTAYRAGSYPGEDEYGRMIDVRLMRPADLESGAIRRLLELLA